MSVREIKDQPPPTGDGREVWPQAIAMARTAGVLNEEEIRVFTEMAKERDRIGRERYGTTLREHNGRDPVVDAVQEALDLVVYLVQAHMEEGDLARRAAIGEACILAFATVKRLMRLAEAAT